MKRTSIRSKDISKELEKYGVVLNKSDLVELVEDNNHKIIHINKESAFFYYQDKLVPTLKYLQQHALLKKVSVDMGAVKFVVNGADVMRPGILQIDSAIVKDEFIAVVDNVHQKPLAVGIALVSGSEILGLKTGKVVKNVHWVGDEIWQQA